MSKSKRGNKLKITADKVQLKSATNGISVENQNQQYNTQKEDLGPNAKR